MTQALLVAGLGAIALKMWNSPTSNEGILEKKEMASAGVDAAVDFASADGISSRDPNVMCSVTPPQMISTSLLPTDGEMSDADFIGITPEKLQGINFLSSGWQIGRDTQANSMRNASHDLRSEPLNPRLLSVDNNSFSNTTISNYQRREFEPQTINSYTN